MTMRILGLLSIILGSLAITGELRGISFPTARWFFNASRELPWLQSGSGQQTFLWFGWLASALLILTGVVMIARSFGASGRDPVMARRMKRFREIKRGYYSLIALLAIFAVAGLDQIVVGKRALAVQYDGKWKFPAFFPYDLKNRDFGVTDGTADIPADYRELKRTFASSGKGRVIMPLVPYDPTGDTLPPRSVRMEQRDGVYYQGTSDEPYYGLAGKYYNIHDSKLHLRFTLRKGILSGPADGWDEDGTPVYNATYLDGAIVSETYSGIGEKDAFLTRKDSELRAVKYHPAPPMPAEGNFLGTTSQNYDVLAYLYGGLQVNLKAALIYLPIVYLVGITIGLLMGFFGGWFDLLMFRLIEILSEIPFLFVIIIIASMVPDHLKGLPVILPILIIFGWMGISTLMRTTAYRDKARDYVAAARVLGAGTPRIVLRHLLPNTISIIVTLIPFTMSGMIFALTSLDYLGFGLPPENATWGRLLNDGLANLSAPWLVSSAFVALVSLLVLITFVGEAVREAFDPKKFTYYH